MGVYQSFSALVQQVFFAENDTTDEWVYKALVMLLRYLCQAKAWSGCSHGMPHSRVLIDLGYKDNPVQREEVSAFLAS